MALTNQHELVEFDVEATLDVVHERVQGTLFAVAEYDATTFNVLYAADETIAMYEDREAMFEHFDLIHDYVNVDFTEMDLFTGSLFPEAERVEYLTTRMDYLKIVRIYSDRQGIFLALEPDEPVEPLADPLVEQMHG